MLKKEEKRVLKTVVRISVMYFSSVIIMRAAGKKEISQLDLSELVTSFMVSEIACMPITDPEVPLHDAIVFSITVVLINVILSHLTIRIPFFKHILAGKPTFFVIKGKINKKAMYQAKVTLSELCSAMRKEGIASLDKINYAILEPDGNISIIPYKDLPGKEKQENKNGLQHMLIIDGKINKSELEVFGFSEQWLLERIKAHGKKRVCDVFFFGVDDQGKEEIIYN